MIFKKNIKLNAFKKKITKVFKNWTKQKWRTKSGKPSGKTGERYLPEKAIKALSSAEYAATTRAKEKELKKANSLLNNQRTLQKKQRGTDDDS